MDPEVPPPLASPPPRAFTQGVGTVFQVVGGVLFLVLMTFCCGSSLLHKQTAQRPELTRIGWRWAGDAQGAPVYSAQRAMSVALVVGVLLGLATAGLGLGMQATRRGAPGGAAVVSALGIIFWLIHLVFAIDVMASILLSIIAAGLAAMFAVLLALAIGAVRDMSRNPPPRGHEVLPEGYKVPYSWYHDDPPEVRLARELEQRRQRLAVQQKEVEMLEERLRKAEEERKKQP